MPLIRQTVFLQMGSRQIQLRTDKGDAPEVTEITEDPIRGNPVGPSTPPGTVSSKFVLCKGNDSPATQTGNTPVSAKGSPFTRYLIKKLIPLRNKGKSTRVLLPRRRRAPKILTPKTLEQLVWKDS